MSKVTVATYNYQEITIPLRPNNSLTTVARHTCNDLPAHIKGVAEYHSLGGVANGYYLPQHLSTQNQLEPIKFLNNSWFGLVFIASKKVYCMHENLQIFPNNKLGLGFWAITNQNHPDFQANVVPTQTLPIASSSGC